ncbi:MAG: phytanoyl-CoA dioxygenase family protein [Planctomycetota bacterium]|nr:phytanoyl-CoA dioxygenase family protein [Planctomycetota bacterium]
MSTTLEAAEGVALSLEPQEGYWAGRQASPEQIAAWVERFHRDGYLLIKHVLPPKLVAQLKGDLDAALGPNPKTSGGIALQTRMFERSPANLSLFDLEPIVSFAEALVAPDCHVVHNNSFISPPGGGISTWHQDDAPHYLVTHGEPPTNVRLPVLLFTANYYLTDVERVEHGGTEAIPGSHLFGARSPGKMEGTKWHEKIDHNLAPAGSVVLFNNQTWHRGGPNTSDRVRYMTQVSYGRRIIGHKYFPFMNYQMPEHIYAHADARRKRLLGFLPSGAYG